ncbi:MULTISPECIES: Do family serine endopeptidase [Rhodomicrobium]|uniref:Do family serine endopeptidase n=1 Tax=Rhodomicrobium TaxID=1068 RepID=UPI001FD8CA96|nr:MULTISPECIES: Do family serine endopeptidase [Rhodomicrobium]
MRPDSRLAKTTRARALVAVGCAGALSLAFLGTTGTGILQTQPAFAQDAANRAPVSFADVAQKVRPAVVSIFTKGTVAEGPSGGPGGGGGGGRGFNFPDLPPEHPFHDFFDQFKRNMPNDQQQQRRPERAQGSGFLISADGYVVTNHHVVDKASEISLTFESDEKYTATVVGTDQRTDIALLKIQGDKKFTNYLEFATVEPRVGDWVLAVGNPFGLGGTVTAGIVSAGGRSIGAGPYDFLQIDAAVNRGNSGGPSVDLSGKVIGVNTAIYSPSGGNVGIAFAIPAKLAQSVVDQLKSSGKVSRGWLGVTIQDVSDDIAESLGMKEAKGALITKIMDDGPSAKTELKVRDVVTRVNGEAVNNSRDLARKVAELQPNSQANLIVVRDGKDTPLTIKLGTFPSSDKLASLGEERSGPNQDRGAPMKELGLTISPAAEVEGAGEDGVAVTEVDPTSEAADKGLKAGDVILEVGGKAVTKPADVTEGIRDARTKGRKAVLMQVRSDNQSRFIALSLNAPKN